MPAMTPADGESVGARRNQRKPSTNNEYQLPVSIVAGSHRYVLVQELKAKRSSTSYRAIMPIHGEAQVLVRVSSAKPRSQEQHQPLPTDEGHADGLIPYSYMGMCEIIDGDSRSSVYCSVRPFAAATLDDVGLDPNPHGIDSLTIASEIAEALAVLHRADIVHGDLKPTNVVVDVNNQQSQLVDFGGSFDNQVKRQVAFAAPEVLLNPRIHPSKPSDVYSFGKILRALLTKDESVQIPVRQRLDYLVAECTHVEPASRPSIEVVVDILEGTTRLGALRPRTPVANWESAALADLDARLPGLPGNLPRIARAAVRRADSIIKAGIKNKIYRLVGLSEAERIHMIVTLSLVIGRFELSAFTSKTFSLRMIDVVQGAEYLTIHPTLDDEFESQIIEEYRHAIGETADESNEDSELLEVPLGKSLGSMAVEMANDLRRECLRNDSYVTSEAVVAIMSRSCPEITVDEVRILRDLGYLLSVRDHQRNIYPLFQFHPTDGLPYTSIHIVQEALSVAASPWSTLAWWFQPNRWLKGETPRKVLKITNGEEAIERAVNQLLAA